MTRRAKRASVLLILLAAVLVAAGCGSSEDGAAGSKPPDYAKALAGAPAPLAALHKQADQLLPGGTDGFEKRIADLKGYPVVANVWASWCGPCRFEFPALQKLSARYGKEVAFVGVNSQDGEDTASSYLAEAPLSYPSFNDPDGKIKESIGGRGLPDTAFYGKGGELCFLRQGGYSDESELEADVRTYALEDECPESG